MEKLRTWMPFRRIIFILCFVAANLIEFTKATQTGDVWYVTVNLTGLVIFSLIASTFSRTEIWNLRNLIWVAIGVLAAAGVWIFKNTSEIYIHLGRMESAVLNIPLLGIAAGVLWRRMRNNRGTRIAFSLRGILWISMMLLMIFSRNERMWPVWFLVMFGLFYLTEFQPEDRKLMLEAMVDGTILSFFLFQIFAYGARPFDTIRYVGFYNNPNTLGLYYLMIYMFVLIKLHLLHMKKAHFLWKLFYFIGAGGLLCFQIFTLCRTAWISSVILTCFYGIVVLKYVRGEKIRMLLAKGVALAGMVAITFLPVFYSIRWLPTLTHYRVWYDGEYSLDKVHSFDPADSDKYVELDEFMDAFVGRIIKTLISMNESNPLVLRAHAEELENVDLVDVTWTGDESTKVRLTIYKTYLERMRWFGNTTQDGIFMIDDTYYCFHGQNIWIQMGFAFGIPVGILMILLTVVLFVYHGKKLKQDKDNPYAIIPMMICIVFFSFGITEIVWLPGQLILFLMFFIQHPRMVYGLECERG